MDGEGQGTDAPSLPVDDAVFVLVFLSGRLIFTAIDCGSDVDAARYSTSATKSSSETAGGGARKGRRVEGVAFVEDRDPVDGVG